MKSFYLSIMAASAIAQSLSDAFSDIPSCSYSALASAMDQEGCSTSDVTESSIDCLCNDLYNIGYDVGYSEALDSDCLQDFVQALGNACGLYLSDTSSSDVPDAVQVLTEEVGGSAGDSDDDDDDFDLPTTTASFPGIGDVPTTAPAPFVPSSSHGIIQATSTGPSPAATTRAPKPLIAGEPSSSNVAGPQATLGMLVPFAAVGVLFL